VEITESRPEQSIGVVIQVSISTGGVPKRAIDEGHITTKGIAGDGWRHPVFHGTRRRAILLMTSEVLDEVAAQGFPVYPGALGENITTRGLDRRSLRIGQRFQAAAGRLDCAAAMNPSQVPVEPPRPATWRRRRAAGCIGE
jgi:MOSC domain-containing protein YiiM